MDSWHYYFKVLWLPQKIQYPSKFAPDDLFMAYKDIRQFRDPVTKVLRYSDAPQNVHFYSQ